MPGVTGRAPWDRHRSYCECCTEEPAEVWVESPTVPAKERAEMMNETRETKATMNGAVGRVIAWHNDKEVSHVSLAVPGDRVKLTPAQARALGKWLMDHADEINGAEVRARAKVMGERLRAAGVTRW